MKMLAFLNPKRGAKAARRRKRNNSPDTMATKTRSRSVRARGHRKVAHASTRRRSTIRARRTRTRTVARRVSRRSVPVAIRNPRRSSGSGRRHIARRSYRRHVRRNPGILSGGSGLLGSVKGAFSKDNLTLAGGIIGAAVLSRVLVNKFGDKLPMVNSTDPNTKNNGVLLYSLALPMVAAWAVRKQSPTLAKGLVIGSFVNTAVTYLAQSQKDTYTQYVAPVSAYLNNQPMPRGLMGVSAPLPRNRTAGYQGANVFRNITPVNGALDNSSAFGGAWGQG